MEVLKYQTKESRRGREFAKAPTLNLRDMLRQKLRHFLVDSADKVALLTKDEPNAKHLEDHRRFVSLLTLAGEQLPDARLFAQTLSDPQSVQQIRDALKDQKAKPTDSITLGILRGDRVEIMVEGDHWWDWWREFRRSFDEPKASESAKPKRPIADRDAGDADAMFPDWAVGRTGRDAEQSHRLSDVGGHSAGDVISSFDKKAFGHYGLSKGGAAAMSIASVKRVTDSLNHLIQNRSRKIAGSKIACWYDRPIPPQFNPITEAFGDQMEDEEEEPVTAAERGVGELGRRRGFADD